MTAAADSRTALKTLALELLIRDGYRGMSFGDIATAAGVTRANLHYHFGSKARLIDEVLTDYVEATLAQLRLIWSPPATSLSSKLGATLDYSRARYRRFNRKGSPPRPWSLISRLRQDEEMLTEAGRSQLRRFTRDMHDLFLTAAERAEAANELRPGATPAAMATLLVAIVDNAAPITMAGTGLASLEAAYEAILSLAITSRTR